MRANKQDLCVPFSNGTEGMNWFGNNCDKCNRHGCYQKKALEEAQATGHITFNVALDIGIKSHSRNNNDIRFIELEDRCKNLNKPYRVKKKVKNLNHPKLFNYESKN